MIYKIIYTPNQHKDGLTLEGNGGTYNLEHIIIDFGEYTGEIDENISTVNGCKAIISNSVFRNGIKLALHGSGDNPQQDIHGRVIYNNCIFENFGRRGPEVQDGIMLTLNNCIIKNWGDPKYFNKRSFGSYCRNGSRLVFNDCVFIQNKFWKNTKQFFVDIGNHIGNTFNEFIETNQFSLTNCLPGVMQGATSINGTIIINDCYKNKKWIYIENMDNCISKRKALDIVQQTYSKIHTGLEYMIHHDIQPQEAKYELEKLKLSEVDTLSLL